ncbi:hypothetical protein B2J88_33270 [Rhodococcus sp. SRB_17]|nr:hypothetical protein [Rhodococcus sp. SRB_17]
MLSTLNKIVAATLLSCRAPELQWRSASYASSSPPMDSASSVGNRLVGDTADDQLSGAVIGGQFGLRWSRR